MNHADHVALLRNGVIPDGEIWADFGSGTGAFTLALAELLGPNGVIHSIDKSRRALRQQKRKLERRSAGASILFHSADFTRPLSLPPLDGIVMANALHFQQRKEPVMRLIRSYLKSVGRFIVIEYNTDVGNRWVPYPLSYQTWAVLADRCGFVGTRLLARLPSSFLGEFYSSITFKPE